MISPRVPQVLVSLQGTSGCSVLLLRGRRILLTPCGVAWFQDFELFFRANSNSTVLKSVYLDIKLGAAFSRILNNFGGKMFTENENDKTINEKIIMKIQK